jgi:phosphatidylglycerophosphate synthase
MELRTGICPFWPVINGDRGRMLQMKITTAFGAFLDPVADKIMVSTALVLLAASPPAPLSQADLSPPVLVIICREITMSSLREWAAASGGGAHKVKSLISSPVQSLSTAAHLFVL